MEPPKQGCAEQDDVTEQAILGLLLGEDQLWAIDELGREIGDRLATLDALRRLEAAGLVYRVDRSYVFASRSARRAIRLWE